MRANEDNKSKAKKKKKKKQRKKNTQISYVADRSREARQKKTPSAAPHELIISIFIHPFVWLIKNHQQQDQYMYTLQCIIH